MCVSLFGCFVGVLGIFSFSCSLFIFLFSFFFNTRAYRVVLPKLFLGFQK